MKRISPVTNTVIAISAGVIVLLGYFISAPRLGLDGLRLILLEWSALLAGVAVLIGIGNLFSVHVQKLRERKPGYIYSVALLVFMVTTLFVGVLPGFEPLQGVLYNGIMVPAEISLLAVLAVTLIYSAIRMLRWRTDWKAFVFIATALLVLLGTGPWPVIGQLPVLDEIRTKLIAQVLASGGARGILIGVALGTLTTGLRILFGADRPYGGK
ncbi:MAG: hypothetical protein EHM81_06385 [Chloroflexi bacterium]|nr:MAG: hypothetical protein EHM81_06385 [Chloroflexota bacterium]